MTVKLGEYILEKQIGKGGMGRVYLAHQESLDRKVAIKVLPKELASDQTFRLRFEREAKMAANLVHPNVIQIYSYGIEKGIPYFAMEYVDGEDIAVKLKRGERFTIRQTISTVKDVAKALDAAHKRNMVHRDIKPSNVMIASDSSVKVMDFGLARAARVETAVTQKGIVMGTPPYMSPEQGKGEPLDIRSDLYSLGILFYELLSGQVPFKAETPTAVIYQHIYEKPKSLREFNQDIPAELESVVMKMIEKAPKERFQTPAELIEVLTAFETDASTAAATGPRTLEIDTSRTITAVPAQEKRLKWLLPAGVATVCAVAILVVLFSVWRPWSIIVNERVHTDETTRREIEKPPVPVADFKADPTSGPAPLTVKFKDNSTGTITSRAWDFDNDGKADSVVQERQDQSHEYSSPGPYTVKLTVTGPGGSNEKTWVDCISVEGKVIANFTADKTRGDAPLPVNFKDASTGTITSWLWDFNNDGLTDSTEQNPSYEYSNRRTYTVKLTVTGPGGSDDEKKVDFINVLPPVPVANFTADRTTVPVLMPVNFTDTSTGTIISWSWNFGDGASPATANTQGPHSVTYSTEGLKTVSLAVTGPGGSDVKTDNIPVGHGVPKKGTLYLTSVVDKVGKAEIRNDIPGSDDSDYKQIALEDILMQVGKYIILFTKKDYEESYKQVRIPVNLTESGWQPSISSLKFELNPPLPAAYAEATKTLSPQHRYEAALQLTKGKVPPDYKDTSAEDAKDVASLIAMWEKEVREGRDADEAYEKGVNAYKKAVGEQQDLEKAIQYWEECKEELEKVPTPHPKYGDAADRIAMAQGKIEILRQLVHLLQEGKSALRQGDFDKAEKNAKRILDSYPTNKDAGQLFDDAGEARKLDGKAKSEYENGQYQAAIEALEELIRICPDYEKGNELLKKAKDALDVQEKIKTALQTAENLIKDAEKLIVDYCRLEEAGDKLKEADDKLEEATNIIKDHSQWKFPAEEKKEKILLQNVQELKTKWEILSRLKMFDDAFEQVRKDNKDDIDKILSLIDPERPELRKDLEEQLRDFFCENTKVKKAKHEEMQVSLQGNDATVKCSLNYEIDIVDIDPDDPCRTLIGQIPRTIKLVRRTDRWYIAAIEDESGANK